MVHYYMYKTVSFCYMKVVNFSDSLMNLQKHENSLSIYRACEQNTLVTKNSKNRQKAVEPNFDILKFSLKQ